MTEITKNSLKELWSKFGYKTPVVPDYHQQIKEPNVDCFAYVPTERSAKCSALNRLYCRYENCRFYKPKEDMK